MQVDSNRLARLERSLDLALNQEWPQLAATQQTLARLQPRPIVMPPDATSGGAKPAVATVATDGGQNRLNLDPIRLQVLRVADSRGRIYFEEFIAQSLKPEEILRFFFKSNERLQRMMADLKLDWNHLIPHSDFQRSQMLSMLRELMEWAALLELAGSGRDQLLIRDGLLRSIVLPAPLFEKLSERFEFLAERHGQLLVGVAKRSRVLSYLSVVLDLTGAFADDAPSYLAIPPDLEREAAPAQYRWIGSRSMGGLHIARLDWGHAVPLIPIDIPAWDARRVDEAIARLHGTACGSFPTRGYPQPLVQAHEHARLGGFEIEMIERMLLSKITERDRTLGRTAREFILMGKRLADGTENESLNNS